MSNDWRTLYGEHERAGSMKRRGTSDDPSSGRSLTPHRRAVLKPTCRTITGQNTVRTLCHGDLTGVDLACVQDLSSTRTIVGTLEIRSDSYPQPAFSFPLCAVPVPARCGAKFQLLIRERRAMGALLFEVLNACGGKKRTETGSLLGSLPAWNDRKNQNRKTAIARQLCRLIRIRKSCAFGNRV